MSFHVFIERIRDDKSVRIPKNSLPEAFEVVKPGVINPRIFLVVERRLASRATCELTTLFRSDSL
jgi:hypothetical protein